MSLMSTAGAVTVTLVPSTPVELVQPLQIASGGTFAATSDPTQIAVSKILSLAFTLPTERVMRPSLGAGIQYMLFSESPIATFQDVAALMQTQFANYEATNFVTSVDVVDNGNGSYLFQVSFVLDTTNQVHVALFDYSGTLVGTT